MRAGRELRAKLADRHQAQRSFIGSKGQYLFDLGIIECPDHNGADVECHSLQMDVLSCVPRLQMQVAFGPLFALFSVL